MKEKQKVLDCLSRSWRKGVEEISLAFLGIKLHFQYAGAKSNKSSMQSIFEIHLIEKANTIRIE